jgi:hypothetical protein
MYRTLFIVLWVACSGPSSKPAATVGAADPTEKNASAAPGADQASRLDAGPVVGAFDGSRGAPLDASAPLDAGAAVDPIAQSEGPTCPQAKPGKDDPCPRGMFCTWGDQACLCVQRGGGAALPPPDSARWECGKARHRKDGCPDVLREGLPCKRKGKECGAFEGDTCNRVFRCVDGAWSGPYHSCAALP